MYILLCGYPPFKGKNHKEIFDKIKTGSYTFNQNEWENVSREAKVLIKKMLTFKVEDRINAESALNDVWIRDNVASDDAIFTKEENNGLMTNIIGKLKNINVSIDKLG